MNTSTSTILTAERYFITPLSFFFAKINATLATSIDNQAITRGINVAKCGKIPTFYSQ